MANIIRCKLPDGVHRFKPFTIKDYRDFLLVRNDMMTKPKEEQQEIVAELANDYFSEFPPTWQQYIFLNVFTSSIGKTKIPIVFSCPECGKSHKKIFNLEQSPLTNPSLKISENTQLNFTFPKTDCSDLSNLVLDNITSVDHDGKNYAWDDLSNETKTALIDSIDLETFESLIGKLKPINFQLNLKCCGNESKLIYGDLHSLFSLLISPDEVFSFYEINHILSKNSYDIDSIMNMLPVERSFALSLVEKDNKK